MTVFYNKTRGHWAYDFQLKGQRYAQACKDPLTGNLAENKTEAAAIEERIRARLLLESDCRKQTNPRDYTLAQAFAAYLGQMKPGSHKNTVVIHVRELLIWFGPATPLYQISDGRVLEYITWAREQKIKTWIAGPHRKKNTGKGEWKNTDRRRSDSTINRYLTTFRTALRMAHAARDPHTGMPLLPAMPKIPHLREMKRLPRPIAQANLDAIIAAAPGHLADAIRLTVLMGFRSAEVFGLTCSQVDLPNKGIWLRAENTKGKRDEFIPASGMALQLLEQLVARARRLGLQHLILYRTGGGKKKESWRPIKNARTAWRRALKQLDLQGQHVFHNTKTTFVTAIAKKFPGAVVQRLARHRNFSTTQRYILVADSLMREAVEAATDCLVAGNGASIPNVISAAAPDSTTPTPNQKSQRMVRQSCRMPTNLLKKLVPAERIELPTFGLQSTSTSSNILEFKKKEKKD
jgi:integrase